MVSGTYYKSEERSALYLLYPRSPLYAFACPWVWGIPSFDSPGKKASRINSRGVQTQSFCPAYINVTLNYSVQLPNLAQHLILSLALFLTIDFFFQHTTTRKHERGGEDTMVFLRDHFHILYRLPLVLYSCWSKWNEYEQGRIYPDV